MSMIMRVARGRAADLERMADDEGDEGTLPPAFANLMATRLAALQNVTPERLAQMETVLRAHPQLGAMAGPAMERLRERLSAPPAPVGAQAAGGAGSGAAGRARARRPEPPTIDLHKSWHVLHYLFTGRAEGAAAPEGLLVEGGREVGEDQGYGPARLLDVADTAAFARFLEGVTPDALKARVDGPRMAALGIYCAGDGSAAMADSLGEDVERYFPMLRDHFTAAAAAGESTLVWLT